MNRVSVSDTVPVAGDYDVLLCGGGPAGVGAAVAAARVGARVLLVEMQGRLGGVVASVPYYCDAPGGPVFDELIAKLFNIGAAELRVDRERFNPPGRYACNPGAAAQILLEMTREANADVLFGTVAERAWLENDAIAGALVVNKGGRSLLRARVVVDCTADADTAASAGAPFLQGDAEDGRIQHGSFRWGVEGIEGERMPLAEELEALCRTAVAAGELRQPDAVFGLEPDCFPFWRESGRLWLGGWELQNVDPTDPLQTTEALAQCQLAALQIVRFLRARVPGCEGCRMTSAGAFVARESRRIVGRYTLTREDVLSAAKFADGLVPAWYFTDLHDPPPGYEPHTVEYVVANRPPESDWYEIPYRCLLPERPAGLLVAGRCVSADRLAHGSLRVMPTCFFLGQAAGTAAARAAEAGVRPDELDSAALKAELLTEWQPPEWH